MAEEHNDKEHKVFQNDPIFYKSLIGKEVAVTTVDAKVHRGRVFVIDPVSESVVLVNPTINNTYNTDILLGHAVKSLDIVSGEENSSDVIFGTSEKCLQIEECDDKKTLLKDWLKKNLIDVKDEGVNLKVGQDLVIVPPYTKDECLSGNTIILERIQDIILKMPLPLQ